MQAEVSFAAPHTSLLLFHQSFLFKNREGFILLKLWVEWTVQFSNPFPGEMCPLSRNLVLLYGASVHQAGPRPQGFWDQKRSDASISCKGVLNENPTPCLLTSASLQACGDSSEGGKDCWLSHVSAPEAEKQLLRNNSLSLRQVVQPPIAHPYLNFPFWQPTPRGKKPLRKMGRNHSILWAGRKPWRPSIQLLYNQWGHLQVCRDRAPTTSGQPVSVLHYPCCKKLYDQSKPPPVWSHFPSSHHNRPCWRVSVPFFLRYWKEKDGLQTHVWTLSKN